MRISILTTGILMLFLLKNYNSLAQNIGDELETSDVLLLAGIDEFDNKNYEGAVEKYSQISKNDTNYAVARYELCIAYLNLKEYEKAAKIGREGLALKSRYDRLFYVQLANAYDYMDKPDSAVYYYSEAIRRFPAYHKPYYEAGISSSRAGNDSAALRYFTKSIQINPFHAGSHMSLAELAARNNCPSAAIMAYTAFLLLENNSERSRNSLVALEKVCNNEYTLKENTIVVSPGLETYDEIIRSRAAQVASYKTKVKLNYYNVIKQVQVLCEKIKANKGATDIIGKFHSPMMEKIWKDGDFEGSMYAMFSGLNNETVQEQVKKNESKIKKMNNDLYEYFDNYRKSIPYNDGKKTYEGTRWFYNNGTIEAVGVQDNIKKIQKGRWLYFSDQGQLTAEGDYDDKGKKNGVWNYYYEDGLLHRMITFKDGVANGEYKIYYSNGQIRERGSYENDKLEGECLGYYAGGAPKFKSIYKKDLRNGLETNYYETGFPKNDAEYIEGKVEGKVRLYHENGKVKEERVYHNGLMEGANKGYYANGKLEYEGMVQADKAIGEWKWYYENGQISKVGSFKNGKETGNWIEYWDNGKKNSEYVCSNGDIDGPYKLFDYYSERAYLDAEYKNGKIKKYKFIAPDGKTLSEGEEKKGTLKWEAYSFNGEKDADGEFVDGKKNGLWIEYDLTGAKTSEGTYKAGKLDGIYKEYYPWGALASERMFKNNDEFGYFRYYHENGKIRKDGYIKDGNIAGEFNIYHVNGNLSSVGYYNNGAQRGCIAYYDIFGRKTNEDCYENDLLTQHYVFDTTGTNYEKVTLNKGNGELLAHFPGGKLHKKLMYKYGLKDGTITWYYPDGSIETEANYKVGFQNGPSKEFYTNGKRFVESNFVDDELDGEYFLYDVEGKLTNKSNYVNGKREGKRQWFYSSGKVSREGSYKNGQCEGEFIYYAEDGTIQLKLNYQFGNVVSYSYMGADGKYVKDIPLKAATGKVTGYYSNGKKSVEMEYKNGKRNGKYIVYNPNGNKRVEIDMQNENYEGSYQEWYSNGNLRCKEYYTSDKLNGVSKNYNEKGALVLESTYVMGVKYGPEKIYDASGKLIKTQYNVNGAPF